jgi:very-short-patch-repair endonuclease
MKRQNVDRARKLRQTMTDTEQKLWYYLRNRQLEGHKFRR